VKQKIKVIIKLTLRSITEIIFASSTIDRNDFIVNLF
ncbi:hypothetical protein GASC598P17_004240, partial [Gilliamella apis SCGC AB-598-P17]